MIARLRSLWRNLVCRRRAERDLDDEVRAVVEMLVDEKVAAGMQRWEAQRAATIELGGVESIKDQVRSARAGVFWDVLVRDMRYGARLLWRDPLFTLTATLSLAIGLGANTTVFTIANALLFRAASGIADADRLVDIAPIAADGRFTEPVVPHQLYSAIRERVASLEGVYGYQLEVQPMSLRSSDGAERIFGTLVTNDYFSVLGVQPAAGRLLGAADGEAPGTSPIVVLSHRFWTRRFDADPAAIGQTLHINGQPLTVVGVAASGFTGTSIVVPDVWVPVSMARALTKSDTIRLAVGGRLRRGTTRSQAAAEIDAIGRWLQRDMPPPPQALDGFREDGGSGSLRLVGAHRFPR